MDGETQRNRGAAIIESAVPSSSQEIVLDVGIVLDGVGGGHVGDVGGGGH